VHLANILVIQQYNGIKYTNDATDARFLAHLLRLNSLPTGFIYPKHLRHVRDLLRRRLLLVKQHQARGLSLQSMIVRHTGKRQSCYQTERLESAILPEYFADNASQFAAHHALKLKQHLQS
jgi:hypothetical protein